MGGSGQGVPTVNIQRLGGSGALLPGRNVAVVHVSCDDHTYPASVSLKEPQNTKAFISKASLLLQGPSRSLGGKGDRGRREGYDPKGEQDEVGGCRRGKRMGAESQREKTQLVTHYTLDTHKLVTPTSWGHPLGQNRSSPRKENTHTHRLAHSHNPMIQAGVYTLI